MFLAISARDIALTLSESSRSKTKVNDWKYDLKPFDTAQFLIGFQNKYKLKISPDNRVKWLHVYPNQYAVSAFTQHRCSEDRFQPARLKMSLETYIRDPPRKWNVNLDNTVLCV